MFLSQVFCFENFFFYTQFLAFIVHVMFYSAIGGVELFRLSVSPSTLLFYFGKFCAFGLP